MLTFTSVINVLSEANRRILAKVDKPIDAVLQLTEPDTPFCTHFMANLFDTTQTTSLNTLPSICLWKTANARAFLPTIKKMVLYIDSEHTTQSWLPAVTDVHISVVHPHTLAQVTEWLWLLVRVFPTRILNSSNSTQLVSMELAA
jgi:hypothetical protein